MQAAHQQRQQDDRDPVVSLRPPEEAGDPLGHVVGEAQDRRDHELGDLRRQRDPLILAVNGQSLGMISLERIDRLGTGEDTVGMRDRLVRADLDRLRRDPHSHVGFLDGLFVLVQQQGDRLAVAAILVAGR